MIEYSQQLQWLWQSKNGYVIAKWIEEGLRTQKPAEQIGNESEVKKYFVTFNTSTGIENEDRKQDIKGRKTALTHLGRAIFNYAYKNYEGAAKAMMECTEQFYIHGYQEIRAWTLPIMKVLIRYTNKWVIDGDKVVAKKNKRVMEGYQRERAAGLRVKPPKLSASRFPCADAWMIKLGDLYKMCNNARIEGAEERKDILMLIWNTYMNTTLKLCMSTTIGKLIVPDTKEMIPERYPKGEQVHYYWLLGRYYMGQGLYQEAETYFCKANRMIIKETHSINSAAGRNKQRILKMLICTRLYRCKYPSQYCLHKYKLTHYQQLIKAHRLGKVNVFQQELERHRRQFVEEGVYILLTKMILTAYRNLLLKCCLQIGGHRTFKFHFEELLPIVQKETPQLTQPELACILNTLWQKKLVKIKVGLNGVAFPPDWSKAFPPIIQ